MSDIIEKDIVASATEEVATSLKKEEVADKEVSEEARKEAEALAREIEKAKKEAEKEAEKEEKAKEKAEEQAEKEAKEKAKEAEKEEKEKEKAEEKAEKEAEKEAKEKAKEAEKEEKAKEKAAEKAEREAEKEAKAKEKAAEREKEDSEDAPKEKKNRYEYFFKRFEAFNKRSRTDELESKYKTSDDVVVGAIKAKLSFIESERYFTRLAEYKISRMVYELYDEKYRFGKDKVTAQIIEEKNRSRIHDVRVRAFKARVSELLDNIRYRRALNLTSERKTLRTIARPAIIDRSKVVLLALLERKREINKELLELYAERNKEYIKADSKSSELNIRLRARKRAYGRLSEVERKLPLYAFTSDEKTRLYDYMNGIVELSGDLEFLRYQKDRTARGARGPLRDAVSAKKDEIEKIEDNMHQLISKARRRTYLDGKSHVWRWIAGVAIVAVILIVLFSIFSEPLTEFILDWALETR